MFPRTMTEDKTVQLKAFLYNATKSAGGTISDPFITADMFTEILRTYYKDYEIIEPVADNDITSNAGWHSYFLDAFGTGLALQKSFETMASTLLPALVLNKVIIETGNDSKEGTNGKTTENERNDTGTISDSGSNSSSTTVNKSTTTTPNGTVVTQVTGSDSGNNEDKLGAWNDANYHGNQLDTHSNQYTNNTTVTDNKKLTINETGNAGSTTGSASNTRTLGTKTTDEGSETGEFSESGEYEKRVTENGGRSIDEIIKALSNEDYFNVVKWFCKQFIATYCYTTVSYY